MPFPLIPSFTSSNTQHLTSLFSKPLSNLGGDQHKRNFKKTERVQCMLRGKRRKICGFLKKISSSSSFVVHVSISISLSLSEQQPIPLFLCVTVRPSIYQSRVQHNTPQPAVHLHIPCSEKEEHNLNISPKLRPKPRPPPPCLYFSPLTRARKHNCQLKQPVFLYL